MTTKTKTLSTYYVKCATQAERDALLDYAVGRGAKELYGRRIDGRCNAFLKDYPKSVWASAGGAEVELTPDSFRRKVRKLWPKETATPNPRKVNPRNPSQLDQMEKAIAGLSERIDAQRMERYALDHAQLDRIEQTLSLIRSGMEFQKELDRVAPESPKPAGIQPGDYCQADEHHSLKEVAERLTAMGLRVYSERSHTYPLLVWTGSMFQGDDGSGVNKRQCPTPEFLSRAEVTAKELGLTPVLPEPFKVGDWVMMTHDTRCHGLKGSVGQIERMRVGASPEVHGMFVPTKDMRHATPAEVQAHQAAIEAKEEAARTPKFGSRVEVKEREGEVWRVISDATDSSGNWMLGKDTMASWAKRHEFKILP